AGNWFAEGFAWAWKTIGHDIPEYFNSAWKELPFWNLELNTDEQFQKAMEQMTSRADAVPNIRSGVTASALRTLAARQGEPSALMRTVDTLEAQQRALQSKLFVSDATSPDYGKLVPGATFPGGYTGQTLAAQQFVS